MLDKQTVLNLAGRLLGPQRAQTLSNAFDMAHKITDATRDPLEAMRQAGLTQSDLTTAKNLINNPMAGMVLNRLGIKRDEILAGINRAEALFNSGTSSTPVEQAPADELSSLQENLARIK